MLRLVDGCGGGVVGGGDEGSVGILNGGIWVPD
jgi:hypothetical protein